MTRVIHTGDTHLGYQQYHEPARREDFLSAFRQVIEDAVAEDVDAVVHAGDLFHDRRPGLADIMGTLSVLRTLEDASIPFLAIVGNHETKRDAQWLDLFESLGLATRLGAEPVTIDGTAFYGLDYVPKSQRSSLAYDFEPNDADHAALVAHGLFQPFDHGDWDAEAVLAESPVDFDAMLLGDDHTPKRAEVGDTWLTYCGSTERTSGSERDDRGYNLVTFDEGVDIRRRGLPTREFVFVDVALEAGEGYGRVRDRVLQHDLEDAVVIVTIEGDGEPITPAEVETVALEDGALVARVNDRREIEPDEEVSISFADPDDAVRERIRELGLSPAARDIDETVRASKVADSNVADRVQQRVAGIVEQADPGAFEAAEGEPDAASSDDASDTGSAEVAQSDGDGQATMEEYL
ncbi:DNA double-strand break repair protein Mre11 [Halapricum desulfuricans]|uniref:DNA double-strand break repair protein Mre11 n=1 Tax=Halapricum desulfuricans TaxID=2841257 RepID=A0A897NAR6_9EURY|nr:DNA double-strand break repair protein Mre11 [Halapricum desulfuricans]QSG09491.1 DNA repair exonuclease, SbcD [Halapricum desulfuricans]